MSEKDQEFLLVISELNKRYNPDGLFFEFYDNFVRKNSQDSVKNYWIFVSGIKNDFIYENNIRLTDEFYDSVNKFLDQNYSHLKIFNGKTPSSLVDKNNTGCIILFNI